MVQGGIDEGEDPQAAAYRELQEETGICSTQRLGEVWYSPLLFHSQFCIPPMVVRHAFLTLFS